MNTTNYNRSDWAVRTADVIAGYLADALSHGAGRASLVVPGGRTAKAVLPLLAKAKVPWERINITLSDERWVGPRHPNSNERLVRECLLDRGAGAAHFVGLKTDAPTPENGLTEVGRRLNAMARPFTIVFLGMGEDGHVASLFPGEPGLTENSDVLAVRRDDHLRLSLTPRALLDSHAIVLAASGTEKKRVLAEAEKPGPAEDFPVRYLLHQDLVPVTIITD